MSRPTERVRVQRRKEGSQPIPNMMCAGLVQAEPGLNTMTTEVSHKEPVRLAVNKRMVGRVS
jgi:hypothetical protein